MENTATTNHIIPAKRNVYKDGWTSNPDNLHIVIPQLRNYVFAIGQADRGRAVYQGPLVENLAFLSARPMVIDNHGGTGADDLFDQYSQMIATLRSAISTMEANPPNGRDYYPQDGGTVHTIQLAIAEHNDRLSRVCNVLAEIEELRMHVMEQQEARKR